MDFLEELPAGLQKGFKMKLKKIPMELLNSNGTLREMSCETLEELPSETPGEIPSDEVLLPIDYWYS